MSSDDMKDIFLKRKPALMVASLHEKGQLNARDISKKAETTYSHAVRVLNRMEDMEVLDSEKKGRSKMYSLTPRGKSVSSRLKKIFNIETGDA